MSPISGQRLCRLSGQEGWRSAPGYPPSVDVTYIWRGNFADSELNELHSEGFGHALRDDEWKGQVERVLAVSFIKRGLTTFG